MEVDKGYYADGEDALFMKKILKESFNLELDHIEIIPDEPAIAA